MPTPPLDREGEGEDEEVDEPPPTLALVGEVVGVGAQGVPVPPPPAVPVGAPPCIKEGVSSGEGVGVRVPPHMAAAEGESKSAPGERVGGEVEECVVEEEGEGLDVRVGCINTVDVGAAGV